MNKLETGVQAEQELIEPIEALIESSLEHGLKFDEGQNAIILEVNADDLDQKMRDNFFSEDALIPENNFVSKVLRIFNAGEGGEEADDQIRAKEIIESQPEEIKANLAKIPEIYTHKDITIHSQELKNKLDAAGIDVSSGKVGALLMYRVQGVDFLNYLLREAIKRCPKDEVNNMTAVSNAQNQLEVDPGQLNTEDIFKAATVAIGLEHSDRIILNETNRTRLLDYLKRHDFVLDSAIIETIERTTKVLNKEDFYHNDLTERNFMGELDDDGQPADVYLIDFEKSSDEEDGDFGGDMAIIGQYKPLTKSKEQEVVDKKDKKFIAIEKLGGTIAKHKPEEYKSIKDELLRILALNYENEKDQESIDIAETGVFSLAGSVVSDNNELVAAILIDISETQPDLVKKYIDSRAKINKTSDIYSNLLSRIGQRL